MGVCAAMPQLPIGLDSTARVPYGFHYFQVEVEDWDAAFSIETTQAGSPDLSLFLKQGSLPTVTDWDFASTTPGTSNEAILVSGTTSPALSSGTWYIGVHKPLTASYAIDWSTGPAPSPHEGIGALPFDDGETLGTTFRVWAPAATAVHVTGGFNSWSPTSAPMAAEGAGTWSLDVRGVGAGAPYKFVLTTPTGTHWRNDARARAVTSSVGDSFVVDPSSWDWGTTSWSTPSWEDLVVYELHIGTLEDTPGGAPGTFASAATRLPYLADLGVTAVELLPVNEFPGDFSWGYNPSQPFAVESAYGGVLGLQDFVRQAHENGIAVLLDVLYNHIGPNDLDLWRYDGWSTGPWGGIYFYNDDRAITPWGDTRPDYGRSEVRWYLRDNAMYWLEQLRCDGFRFDSVLNIRESNFGPLPDGWSLLQWINDTIDGSQGWKISIAEDMQDNAWITRPTSSGGAGFDAQWDAQFVHPIRGSVIAQNDSDRDMWAVADAIGHSYNGQPLERVIYTESHDEVANGNSRLPEQIWPGNASSWYSKKRSTLAAAAVFTAPGIPMIFQGQEILEDGWFQDDDPVDWSKLTTFAGIHDLYRDLISLRRNLGGTTAGLKGGAGLNIHHVNDNDKVIAFHRWAQGGPGDDVIVLLNFKSQAWTSYDIGLPRSGDWHVRFNSDWNGYDASFGNHPSNTVNASGPGYDGMPFRGTLSFGPYTAIVLSQ